VSNLVVDSGRAVYDIYSLLDLIASAGYFCPMVMNFSSSASASISRGFPAGSFGASGALLFKLADLRLPFGSK
jgi:hypothetical protein